MKITTKTGSVYTIDDGFCVKTDKNGNRVDAFKLWTMKSLPKHVKTWDEVHELPGGEPVIGECLYLAGKDVWWVSSAVVDIEP